MTPRGVNELIDARSQPLTDEHLTEMSKSASEEYEDEQEERGFQEETESVGHLTTIVIMAKDFLRGAQ